jgi:hypothetical protein
MVLDPTARHHFDGIVTRLRDDDPRFVRRFESLHRAERRNRTLWAVLLWAVPPLLIIFGGRAGLPAAVGVCVVGAYVTLRRRGGRSGRNRRRHGVP